MMTSFLLSLFNSFGLVIFFLGMQGLIFIPLTLFYEAWKRRTLRAIPAFDGMVSVIIPAYNEEKTIRPAVVSVLASLYRNIEVIVVNDGSTDCSEEAIADFIKDGRIRYIKKPNGGKASALNMGIDAAQGEVALFTDADSVFLPDTVGKMVRWFGDPSIHAVCGNDTPLHPETPIQRFLAVTTHIGTGFVRRALSIVRCLPIITGNLGAIRTDVLREIKGFSPIWGEDLEITFRLYRNRKRIIFDPEPKVIAECPGTLAGLWKQRIRWIRSYIKISLLNKDLFFRARYAPFSFYLPVNFLNMAIVPLLQIAILILLPWAYITEHLYFTGAIELLTFLGIIFFAVIAIYSIVLDKAYSDLVYLPYGLLIVPLSFFYNAVAAYSWWQEIMGAQERWDKIERRRVFASVRPKWEYAAIALLLVAVSSTGTYYYMTVTAPRTYNVKFDLALSTHFDAWGDWRKAVSSVLKRPDVGVSRVIGVSAGRPEWVYFKWKTRPQNWSNHQAGAKEDLLERASATFHKSGFKVAAFIDVYGPKYIKEHPGTAAVGFDGKVHGEQVSFTELVDGNYGNTVIDMIGYLAGNYEVDIINLTEMPYYSYSYNSSDLKSYRAFTGEKEWPRTADGRIDREDPSIWEWRSSKMEGFIERAAGAAHRHNKELYVDVPVSWTDISRNAKESGLDYRRVLKHADNIVVWNYFYLDGLSPKVSETLSSYMASNFSQGSYFISIGLWGKTDSLDAERFAEALKSTVKGGSRRIWVTPDSLLTPAHWEAVLANIEDKGL